jgi:hypothetical protein
LARTPGNEHEESCPIGEVDWFLPISSVDQCRTKSRKRIIFSNYVWNRLLVEVEGNFDLHAAIYRLAAGAYGRAHLPILHLRHGFFF